MGDWADEVDRLLYAGETIRNRVGNGPAEVVVTSHRLLAFTPQSAGPNYRAVDRPNVESVTIEATGRRWFATGGIKALAAGGVALGTGAVVDLGGVLGTLPAGAAGGGVVGAGGILQALDLIATALSLADEALLALGALLLLGGVGALAAYWTTRRRELVVLVAGDDDIRLDGTAFTQSDRDAIEELLGGP